MGFHKSQKYSFQVGCVTSATRLAVPLIGMAISVQALAADRWVGRTREIQVVQVDSGRLSSAGTKTSQPESQSVLVLVPEIAEPFRTVFSQIIDGIEDRVRAKVITVRVTASTTAQEISAEIRRQDARSLVALGQSALRLTSSTDFGVPVIGGAVVAVAEPDVKNVVVTLAPDPAILFSRLKKFAPAVRRVHVVYGPNQNGWLIKIARDAAKTHGIELVRYEVSDLKAAARTYHEILSSADNRRDAIWLPQDSIAAEESAILPFVLEESWNRSITLFSSSLAHVRRGALFSLYPNHSDLGRRVGDLALSAGSWQSAKGLQPLQDTYTAVNMRTANHLGISVKEQDAQLLFPTP